MQCVQCSSSMVIRDGMWVCDTCFHVAIPSAFGDDTIIEEGLMLGDILSQMEEQTR